MGKSLKYKTLVVYQLIDKRDLETGQTAMSRTVGYIGALMIGTNKVTKRGVLSPANDIPYRLLARELRKRDIRITSEFAAYE